MSKPLELVIYPKLERPSFGWQIEPYRERWRGERAMRLSKRLTEAELSAEYWRAGWIAESERSRQADRVAQTIYRFATLPHYDEVSA